MPVFKAKITQIYRVEKWITIDIEAEDEEEAIDTLNERDSPSSSDPWEDHWSLENEVIQIET
ncbi:hypothetical protein [Croceicoccus mobilis]|uniref:Uncharacterized protein n=1 Tax=Croceicoccus mobilis TaxID=1703339 RepID=A0A917DZP6_9SPHN|nr:hypothetical protein [Croceicoccus mobilis]GGD82346.1 hypothetical protein GCM10010990_35470 [Croceicoccus mobilis]